MRTSDSYESNELIDRLPKHLKQFILPQDYQAYTPVNQAVWRYVMRKNVDFLSKVAHESYLDGLEKTGIDVEAIPSLYGMNRILKEIGWAAVAVDGFIPPNAFMEFQAHKVLVIASDIRQLEHIEYTPAPDIIHEAAGHAPIIANPDYAEYLRRLGAIGAKAILSRYDIELYEAVRKVSILKEAAEVDPAELARAEEELRRLSSEAPELSEMAQIRNLQWWSVEYGLIGSVDNFKIYGAGLLSSIGESQGCLRPEVKKLPYSIAAAAQSFDITQPQPQLFVTPDFSYLMEVLEAFANTLSLRRGGVKGVRRLIESGMVGTIELNTGLQISGAFNEVLVNDDNEVIFFRTEGPTALAYREKELIGHGIARHAHGFSSPLGKLKNINLAIEDMGPYDLKAYNFYDNRWLSFEFESGIRVEGMNVTGVRNVKGQLMLIQLTQCTVTFGDKILFRPEWGDFDMAVGSEILSAFAGAADPNSFPNLYGASEVKTVKTPSGQAWTPREQAYAAVRAWREGHRDGQHPTQVAQWVLENEPGEWLLLLELVEVLQDGPWLERVRAQLQELCATRPGLESLILSGLELIDQGLN